MLYLLQIALLLGAVYLYFHIGCTVFPSLKKSLLVFSSLMLMASGILAHHQVYIALWVFLLTVFTLVLSRRGVGYGRSGKESQLGLLYINFASIPMIVFLARQMGNL